MVQFSSGLNKNISGLVRFGLSKSIIRVQLRFSLGPQPSSALDRNSHFNVGLG